MFFAGSPSRTATKQFFENENKIELTGMRAKQNVLTKVRNRMTTFFSDL